MKIKNIFGELQLEKHELEIVNEHVNCTVLKYIDTMLAKIGDENNAATIIAKVGGDIANKWLYDGIRTSLLAFFHSRRNWFGSQCLVHVDDKYETVAGGKRAELSNTVLIDGGEAQYIYRLSRFVNGGWETIETEYFDSDKEDDAIATYLAAVKYMKIFASTPSTIENAIGDE